MWGCKMWSLRSGVISYFSLLHSLVVWDKTAARAPLRPCGHRNISWGDCDGMSSPMFVFLVFFRAMLQAMNVSEELKCLRL